MQMLCKGTVARNDAKACLAGLVLVVCLVTAREPAGAQAKIKRAMPVVVHPVKCERWRCSKGLQMALTFRVTSALTRGRRCRPVDKANLDKAIGEQLSCRKGIKRGIISRECMIEVGRVMQAQKMITGHLVSMGGKDYQLTLNVTDLATVKNERSVSESCWNCGKRQLLSLVDRTVAKQAGGCVPVPSAGSPGLAPAVTAPQGEPPPPAAEVGHLRVEGSPRGAKIRLRGPRKFRGPVTATLPRSWNSVPHGRYQVVVSAPQYESQKLTVQVLPDRTEVARLTLLKSHGTLTIEGKPRGARVEVSGPKGYKKVFGLGRWSLRQVQRGHYRIKVSRAGYTTDNRLVEVTAGDPLKHWRGEQWYDLLG